MSGSVLDASSSTQIFRKDFPQIIALKREAAVMLGVRLKYRAEGYKAGRVLGRYDMGPNQGLFDHYDDTATGASSGLATAACILLQDIDLTGATATYNPLSKAAFAGYVYQDALLGLDANAKTDLKARTIIGSDGVSVLEF